MRKIIATEFYSLDGFMSDPQDNMDWVVGNFDPDLGRYEDEMYELADTLLLGRTTYKIFEGYWPNAEFNPQTPPEDIGMARKINAITKVVFSRTLDKVEWQNSKLIKELRADDIMRMKQAPGRNMLIPGSASIVQQLTDLRLIDEYHFVIFPVLLSKGKQLFNEITNRVNLNLLYIKPFRNGAILLQYGLK